MGHATTCAFVVRISSFLIVKPKGPDPCFGVPSISQLFSGSLFPFLLGGCPTKWSSQKRIPFLSQGH